MCDITFQTNLYMKIAAHLKTQSNSPDLESNFPQKILRTMCVG